MTQTTPLVVRTGMPAAVYRWYFGAHSLKNLRRNILSFVGIKLVEAASAKRRAAWLANVAKLGSKAR